MSRLTCDDRTKTYVAKRRLDSKADLDIIRRLNRFVAREVFPIFHDALTQPENLAPTT